jgi:hypothetical protein
VSEVPREFLDRITEHNRSCWAAAVLGLLGASLAWLVFFALYTGGVLVFETVRTGNTDLFRPPAWYWPAGAAAAGALLLWGGLDRWKNRFRLPPDRPIIGWHLVPEFLLLPAKMTFSIWDHLDARVSLKAWEREEAWRLLQVVYALKRAELPQLAQEFPDTRQRTHLLTALQLTNWIDLHRGEETWFYRVLSDQEPLLRSLIRAETAEEA